MSNDKSPEKILESLLKVDGVLMALVVDKEGLLLANAGEREDIDIESLGALASAALSSARSLGEEFKNGILERVIIEFREGKVLLSDLGEEMVLAVFASQAARIGVLRVAMIKISPSIKEAFSF